ncbi:MAG TPA: SRPBCC family protein [Pseudomonadota bacterium]|jgi:hypothetical protein|nr:SRPBCC family protein [Pseudomonadota bacterium]HNK43475.1 SRPBCC family protein [Pseudomonadota bacterium]HNN50510.1 SRPBCC family protein [Pseudomonadota bacterium]
MASLRISILAVPLFFVAPAFAEDAAPSALTTATMNPVVADAGWKFASDKGGVSVWFRPFPASSVNEVRGEAVFDVAADALFAVLGDIDAYAEIMPPTSLSKRLSDGTSARSYYIEIDPPVVSRRYYCMDVVLSRPRVDQFVSEWRMWPQGCSPRARSMVQMADNSGRWRLSSLGPLKTKVEFQAHMDPGGQIPTWMVNRTTVGQIANTFASLRRAAQSPRYAAMTKPEPQGEPERPSVSSKTN